MSNHVDSHNKNQQTVLSNQITRLLEGLRFGSIEIVVHDSKVVQIERKEKLRLDASKHDSPSKCHSDH
jgi:hypothetical protein